jgi:prepilin-type N-terminal cleavage/methylation domain-containing protein
MRAGFTLIEVLIAVTLVSMLSLGMMMAMRVGLSALDKSNTRLDANRRAASTQRILKQEIEGLMPVRAECQTGGEGPPARISFFQGEPQSMRFTSSFSLGEGSRGIPLILEFQVIPGEGGRGVRLVVNERLYTGPLGAGAFCLGMVPDLETGKPAPQFVPIQTGPASFVLADKLAACHFQFRDPVALSPKGPPVWLDHWVKQVLPDAIRVSVMPLDPDPAKLPLMTLTVPLHITREPLVDYGQ